MVNQSCIDWKHRSKHAGLWLWSVLENVRFKFWNLSSTERFSTTTAHLISANASTGSTLQSYSRHKAEAMLTRPKCSHRLPVLLRYLRASQIYTHFVQYLSKSQRLFLSLPILTCSFRPRHCRIVVNLTSWSFPLFAFSIFLPDFAANVDSPIAICRECMRHGDF